MTAAADQPAELREPSSSLLAGLLSLLALLSGCCALAYEVLLVRALTTVLGDMFYVHAALLATFLAGVGLGAKLAARAVGSLAFLEIATGVYGAMLPLTLPWFSGRPFMTLIVTSPVLTIVATIFLVIVPSLLIGFTIPLFSAYVKARVRGRLAFQRIYVAYNLGALLSVLVVEFVLVRRLGVATSLMTIGGINVLNGIVLAATRAAPASPSRERPRALGWRLTTAVILAGVASALFQMFFLKLVYLVFAPHRENFAVALAVSLLGLFVGAFLASRFPVSFTTLVVLVPVVLGVTYACYEPLVRLALQTAPDPMSGDPAFVVHKLLIGSAFALVPLLLLGGTLPALMREEREVAGEAGALLCASGLANAAGYLLYVLVAHPLLPAHAVLAAIGLLALAATLVAGGGRPARWQMAAAAAGVAALAVMGFRWDDAKFYLAHRLASYGVDWRVTTLKSGAENVTLVERAQAEWMTYNGHPSIVVRDQGRVNLAEMVSGVIPALGAPRLDRVLVLGVGTGITAGTAARIFTRADAVEINPAFVRMLPRLAYANFDLKDNHGATVHLADGRTFLAGREGMYDAIVNSIPAPTYYSASKIYTVEFYERVRRALKPDGVFSTWLSPEEMSERGLFVILSAIRRSFPSCDLRLMRGDYYMATCAARPISPRPFHDLPVHERLERELRRSAPWADLGELFVDQRVSEDVFARFAPQPPRENTDDLPELEFELIRKTRPGAAGRVDPFLVRSEQMQVDPTRGWHEMQPDRAARRAGTLFMLNRMYFTKFVSDLLADSRAHKAAFAAWLEEHVRGDRSAREEAAR